jgi:hypothetical protein
MGASSAPHTPTSAPARKSAKPTGSRLSPTQQQNVSQLKDDLNAIQQGSTVTQAQVQALSQSLQAMADGAVKPNPATVDKLAADLSQATADGKMSSAEKARLAADVQAVMNSAQIPAAEVNQAIADAQAILQASGVTRAEAQAVAADLRAIASELQSNAAAAKPGSRSGGPAPTLRRRRQ